MPEQFDKLVNEFPNQYSLNEFEVQLVYILSLVSWNELGCGSLACQPAPSVTGLYHTHTLSLYTHTHTKQLTPQATSKLDAKAAKTGPVRETFTTAAKKPTPSPAPPVTPKASPTHSNT